MPATVIRPSAEANTLPLTISAGRALVAVSSAYGNGTRTTSPLLNAVELTPVVIDGIFLVVPKLRQRRDGHSVQRANPFSLSRDGRFSGSFDIFAPQTVLTAKPP